MPQRLQVAKAHTKTRDEIWQAAYKLKQFSRHSGATPSSQPPPVRVLILHLGSSLPNRVENNVELPA